jgi:hypothetical protein
VRTSTWRAVGFAVVALVACLASPATSWAQHGDYLLGTLGLLGGAQAPEGIYYSNIFSYYNASGSRRFDAQGLLLQKELTLEGSIDAYIDQNIIGVTTPFKILGASYGAMIDIPFAHVRGDGNASLDLAGIRFDRFSRTFAAGESSTASFNIADIYVEPMNFGWHWSQLDVMATFGFFAPSGSYDADKFINNGLGRWAEMFGLGAVAYLDAARSWSVSAMTRYLTHQKQQGAEIRVGDDFLLEWGLGKTFRPSSWKPWVAQLDTGVVGYGQWQVTDNRGSEVSQIVANTKSRIFAVGPEIAATTKFGRFFFRYEFEFGGHGAPQGQVLLFGASLLIDPFK